jgi:hypothetical protein
MSMFFIGAILLVAALLIFFAACLFPEDHQDDDPLPTVNNVCYHVSILLLGASLMAFAAPAIIA